MVLEKIPYQIFMTMEPSFDQLPPNMKNNFYKWIKLNPEFSIYYFSGKDRKAMIAQEFENEVSRAYQLLNSGVAKADFWRICILYIYGGIYCDIDLEPLKPVHDFLPYDCDMLAVRANRDKRDVGNGIIAIPPRQQLLWEVIQLQTDKIIKSYNSNLSWIHPQDLVGSGSIAEALARYLGNQDKTELKDYKNFLQCFCIYILPIEKSEKVILNGKGQAVLKLKYGGYFEDCKKMGISPYRGKHNMTLVSSWIRKLFYRIISNK